MASNHTAIYFIGGIEQSFLKAERILFFLEYSKESVAYLTYSGVVKRPLYCSDDRGVLPSQTALWWYRQQLVLTVAVIHELVGGILKIYFDFFWKLRVILWYSITGWCDTKFCDGSSQLAPPPTFQIQILVAIHHIRVNVAIKISVAKANMYIFPCLKMHMLKYY